MVLFDRPENFINRELSWLQFNKRVLEEALDKNNLLLERLKFISIVSSNLDEFFMVRVAAIRQQLEAGLNKPDPSGLTPKEQLLQIAKTTHDMVKKQYRCLKNILRSLTKEGIFFTPASELTNEQRAFIDQYFYETVYPVITPMAVDASRPFPFLANRSLNLAMLLQSSQGETLTAVVQVPSVLPRIIELPQVNDTHHFIFLEEIIKLNSSKIFTGYTIKSTAAFRITRNADLFLDEEETDDLLTEVEKSLRQRRWGEPVRLEIEENTDKQIHNFLSSALDVNVDDIYAINGSLDTTAFMKFSSLDGYDYLRNPTLIPQHPEALINKGDLFEAIKEKDILVHHPYESFDCVLEFVKRAATDPNVLAIKQTLYRVSGNSPVVQALAQAAENGKQVTVLVELKARFDEENNILWARRLDEAGCHVIYGLVGLKTHCKITLVVRRESDEIFRYVHLGTGNYNDNTAKFYSDLGLFTANAQFGVDASTFFNVLSGYSDPPLWNKIEAAPLGLRKKLYNLIQNEIDYSTSENPGHIIAKMNSLIDKDLILKLYEASNKGVTIDLIVRGICGLRPGIPDVSDNITVHSIVGRFLEHSRIFYFKNNGDEKIFLSSADWMTRNMDRRVELLFPVEDKDNMKRIKEILAITLSDTLKTRILQSDGTYKRVDKRNKNIIESQLEFYSMAVEAIKEQTKHNSKDKLFQPVYKKAE